MVSVAHAQLGARVAIAATGSNGFVTLPHSHAVSRFYINRRDIRALADCQEAYWLERQIVSILNDCGEGFRFQRRPTHKRSVNFRLCHQP